MNKTYKAVICSILLVTLLVGLGALAYAPNSEGEQNYIQNIGFSVDTGKIFIDQSSCNPKKSEATLKIVGANIPALDLILVVDQSKAIMERMGGNNEKLKKFIGKFRQFPVKMGLVSLAAPKEDIIHLSEDLGEINKEIEEMTPSEGLFNLSEGMNKAIDEFIEGGRSTAVKVMAIITAYHGKIAWIMIPTWEAIEEDILVFTVGMDYPNYPALRWIAQETGAKFYNKPSNFDDLFQQIRNKLSGEVAKDIEVTVTLPDHVSIDGLANGCRKSGSTVRCDIDKLENGGEWKTNFQIASHEKRDIHAQVELEFTNPEGKRVTIEQNYSDIIEVPNHRPEAKFSLMIGEEDPNQLTYAEKIEFVNQSQDCDGDVNKCKWIMDRDKLSEECNFSHQFEKEDIGKHRLCLQVWDDNGGDKDSKTDKTCKQIEVQPILETSNETDFFLPDEFPPERDIGKLLVHEDYHNFYSQIHIIQVNTDLYGVRVVVNVPSGWEVKDVQPDECKFVDESINCLFKKIERGKEKTISYEIRPPKGPENCMKATFSGKVSAIDPFLQPGVDIQTIEVMLINYLSLERALSCWDVEEARLNPEECGINTELEKAKNRVLITESQKEQALAWWERKEAVPCTEGEAITDESMAHIIKCWKKKIPLAECIQQPMVCPKKEVPESQAENQTSCINTASPADLEKIAGIGSKTATSISEILPIQKWEDLLEADGIGEKTLELIKKHFNLC